MSDATVADIVRACRASAQADTLTVVCDLTRIEPAAEDAIVDLLGLRRANGDQMPAVVFDSFVYACRLRYNSLLDTDPAAALQLATTIGVFFHECRHIHDLRATWIGAELVLLELLAYNDGPWVLGALAEWQRRNPRSRMLHPLTTADLVGMGLDPRVVVAWERSVIRRGATEGLLEQRSAFWCSPGASIRDLFEALGFLVQIDVTAHLFGEPLATLVLDAMTPAARAAYLPLPMRLRTSCDARGTPPPEGPDLSSLVVHALSVSPIVEAFTDDGRTTDRHPGAWFDRLVDAFARTPSESQPCSPGRATAAAEHVMERAGLGTRQRRVSAANDRIEAECQRLASLMAPDLASPHVGAAILALAEVASDFRAMHHAAWASPGYHHPVEYARMVLAGSLPSVYLRLRTRAGPLEVRTPSDAPATHLGALRAASNSAKQMRRLATRPFEGDFLDDALFEQLLAPPPEGPGLNLWLR